MLVSPLIQTEVLTALPSSVSIVTNKQNSNVDGRLSFCNGRVFIAQVVSTRFGICQWAGQFRQGLLRYAGYQQVRNVATPPPICVYFDSLDTYACRMNISICLFSASYTPVLFDPTMQLDDNVWPSIAPLWLLIMILGLSSSIVVVAPLDYYGVEVFSKGQVFTGKRVVHPQPDWWYVGGRMMPGESPARRYQDTHKHTRSVSVLLVASSPLSGYTSPWRSGWCHLNASSCIICIAVLDVYS